MALTVADFRETVPSFGEIEQGETMTVNGETHDIVGEINDVACSWRGATRTLDRTCRRGIHTAVESSSHH